VSRTSNDHVKALFSRLAKTAHDPRQSMIYEDFGTEFYAGYFPATFDHNRLLGHISKGLWGTYPDTPRFLATYRRPGSGRNFLTLYFASLAEKQNVTEVIDRAVRLECALTGENHDRIGHHIYTSQANHYRTLVYPPATQGPWNRGL
jgi:hypothetical protein